MNARGSDRARSAGGGPSRNGGSWSGGPAVGRPETAAYARLAVLAVCAACALLVGFRPAGRAVRRAVRQVGAAGEWRAALRKGGVALPGEAACWLELPHRAGSFLVRSDATRENLTFSPCVLSASGAGPRVILGHRDAHFARLGRLRPGDALTLQGRDGTRRAFTVRAIHIVPHADTDALLAQQDAAALVLVTCHPFAWIGPAPERFLVVCM